MNYFCVSQMALIIPEISFSNTVKMFTSINIKTNVLLANVSGHTL